MHEADTPAPKPKPKKTAKVAKGAGAKTAASSHGLTAAPGMSKPAAKSLGSKKGTSEDAAGIAAAAATNKRRAVHARQERILRHLALLPPQGSPYAYQLCLAGAEGLLGKVGQSC